MKTGQIYKSKSNKHYGSMPLCVLFGTADLGTATLDDGREVLITWGRNLNVIEQDYWSRKGCDLALDPYTGRWAEFIIPADREEWAKSLFTVAMD